MTVESKKKIWSGEKEKKGKKETGRNNKKGKKKKDLEGTYNGKRGRGVWEQEPKLTSGSFMDVSAFFVAVGHFMAVSTLRGCTFSAGLSMDLSLG